jgi:hypothetical protein
MATKTVDVVLTTSVVIAPLGTVQDLFSYVLTRKSDGFELSRVETPSLNAIFPEVPEGEYVMTVSANGVSASAEFTIEATEVSINVPASVTVTLV